MHILQDGGGGGGEQEQCTSAFLCRLPAVSLLILRQQCQKQFTKHYRFSQIAYKGARILPYRIEKKELNRELSPPPPIAKPRLCTSPCKSIPAQADNQAYGHLRRDGAY